MLSCSQPESGSFEATLQIVGDLTSISETGTEITDR